MIVTTSMLIDQLSDEYSNPKCRIARMVKEGKYTPIIRGLYETDPKTEGYLLASAIYNPSYLSFDYALNYHGLIPERVYTFTSATFGKNRSKMYKTPFGVYTYNDVPKDAFAEEVNIHTKNGYTYLMASPEKAMCDKMYSLSPIGSLKNMDIVTSEDLRIYEEDLNDLNIDKIESLSELYQSKNVSLFSRFVRRM